MSTVPRGGPPRRLSRDGLLAGGIYQALITTVAGLLIAIPLTLAQEHIRKENNRILGLLDLYLAEIKEWLAGRNHKGSH